MNMEKDIKEFGKPLPCGVCGENKTLVWAIIKHPTTNTIDYYEELVPAIKCGCGLVRVG